MHSVVSSPIPISFQAPGSVEVTAAMCETGELMVPLVNNPAPHYRSYSAFAFHACAVETLETDRLHLAPDEKRQIDL